jgi:hypothetical protein
MFENMVPIFGKTFPVRDELKIAGARWNKDFDNGEGRKPGIWMIDRDKLDQALKIVKGQKVEVKQEQENKAHDFCQTCRRPF